MKKSELIRLLNEIEGDWIVEIPHEDGRSTTPLVEVGYSFIEGEKEIEPIIILDFE